MSKKNASLLILFVIFVAGTIIFMNKDNDSQTTMTEQEEQKKIKVAACPTCFGFTKNIDTEKYEIIKTASTAESLAMLQNQKVDMILAGRTLKPNEPQMDRLLIKEGYSFLSDKEYSIYIDQLKNQTIYTDLDIEVIKNIMPLQKIEQVNNIYDYLDKGIVVTSWENTDYTKAKIVHILENNGERFELSRQPTVYCPNYCGKEAQELALLINK